MFWYFLIPKHYMYTVLYNINTEGFEIDGCQLFNCHLPGSQALLKPNGDHFSECFVTPGNRK